MEIVDGISQVHQALALQVRVVVLGHKMNIKKDDIITFNTHFQCKCQQIKDINQFIKSSAHAAEITLLCPICERKYRISLIYEEIF